MLFWSEMDYEVVNYSWVFYCRSLFYHRCFKHLLCCAALLSSVCTHMLNKTRFQLQWFKLVCFTSFFGYAGAIYAVSQLAWLRIFWCRVWLKLGDKSDKTVRDYLMVFQHVLLCLNIKSSTLQSFHKSILFLHITLSCWGKKFISFVYKQ